MREEGSAPKPARATLRLDCENLEEENHCSVWKMMKMDTPIDRLSALPDSLLLHILSFLGVKEAAITSVLSKRWRFLFADLPRLEFRESSRWHKKLRQFVDWVNRALHIHSTNYLEKFELDFTYYKRFDSDVNAWIEFCVNNKVKFVDLVLEPWNLNVRYTLPQMVYSASSLTCLKVSDCIMSLQRAIEWGSLTKLHLQNVELSRHLFENILSGCPVLYDLILEWCWGSDRLDVYSRSLAALAIMEWKGGSSESLLEISAPYIQSLEISTNASAERLRLTDIESLVSVKISLFDSWNARSVEVEQMNYVNELFGSIQHVKKLELRGYCTEILSMMVKDGWRLPESSREHLIVDVSTRNDQNISVIVQLLESSPKLETLVIKGHRYYRINCTDLNRDLFHLKTINITGFMNSSFVDQPLLTLAQIFLKRAVVLEKILIDVKGSYYSSERASSDYINVAQTLLSYRRSSTKATIILRC